MTVIGPILGASGYTETNGLVETINQTYIVKDLTPSDDIERDALNEISAAPTNLPPGAAGPVAGLIVIDRGSTAIDPTICLVTVQFGLPGGIERVVPQAATYPFDTNVSGAVSLEQIMTQLDKDGNAIKVAFDQGGGSIEQGGEVPKMIPRATYQFDAVVTLADPIAATIGFVGTVNETAAWMGLTGQPLRTWMLVGAPFRADTSKTGELVTTIPRWRLTYQFAHDPNGFDPGVWFIDPETGRPPANLVAGVGYPPGAAGDNYYIPAIYQESDFNNLPTS